MDIVYGERWHTKQMAPIFPLTEQEARARHASGELYTAAIGDPRAPKLVELCLKEGYVGVRWFKPDGWMQVHVFDNINRTVKEGAPMQKDVSLLWEDLPEFGDYESVSRRER